MATEMGEYLVGAYLRVVLGCDVVDYNVRLAGGGSTGQNELDVVGMDFDRGIAYLCEVATHVKGLNYGKGNADTVLQLTKKHDWQRSYASQRLAQFPVHRFMFWSPNVPVGALTKGLSSIETLELVVNGEYKRRVAELAQCAGRQKEDIGNPAFRLLQVLEALRD